MVRVWLPQAVGTSAITSLFEIFQLFQRWNREKIFCSGVVSRRLSCVSQTVETKGGKFLQKIEMSPTWVHGLGSIRDRNGLAVHALTTRPPCRQSSRKAKKRC